ncbi:hypothetical protein BDF19DRAFT_410331 [Syncephalis fuscata]|nr:hypothetical protein BDF19DRAFT_410331 [Syncephalis fuscata]
MLVSVTQVTLVNGTPGLIKSKLKPEPKPESDIRFIQFMGIKNNDPINPFNIHGIQFTGIPYEVRGVHYVKGRQHKQPITLACGPDPNPRNSAFQHHHQQDLMAHSSLFNSDKFSVAVPKGSFIIPGQIRCYALPGQCEQTYDNFAENPLSDMDKLLSLWQNIGSGLDAIGKVGWYAHKNFDDICITKSENDKYIPQFFSFDNAVSVKKELDYETVKIRSDISYFILEKIFRLVPDKVKVKIICKFLDKTYTRRRRVVYSSGWLYFELKSLGIDECLETADENTIDALEGMLLTNNPSWHSHQ